MSRTGSDLCALELAYQEGEREDDLRRWSWCVAPSSVYAPVANFLSGHGAPAILATLWIEGSLAKFFPQYSLDKTGLRNLIAGFSTPGGFPSHINAEVPGSIHEGGELGYALAVAFGAVMDKPELIVPVIIGDGEAETGPTAALVVFLAANLPRTITLRLQCLACRKVHRPEGVGSRPADCSCERLQDQRTNHLRVHGRQGDDCAFHWLRLPG